MSDSDLRRDLEAQLRADMAGRTQAQLAAAEDGVQRAREAIETGGFPRPGAEAPDFTLPNVHGQRLTLSHVLERGPAIVVFYRGGWCPYCNIQLRAYQDVLPEVEALGGQLVAISPQLPDESLSTAAKNELAFEVLSDVGNAVARLYGLVFRVVEGSMRELDRLTVVNGDDSRELPVPATFVIGRGGLVEYAFVDPEYRHRAEPRDLVDAVRASVATSDGAAQSH